MNKYRYYKGSRNRTETIEFDLRNRNGSYITTCAINVSMLLSGVRAFPCGNGDDVKLDSKSSLEILKFLQTERNKLTDVDGDKTYKDWSKSGLHYFEDYFKPGDRVDETVVDFLINSVPPITLRGDCTQPGETFSTAENTNGVYQNTYITFHRTADNEWQFDGYCFRGENENRHTAPTTLERLIEIAEYEVNRKANK